MGILSRAIGPPLLCLAFSAGCQPSPEKPPVAPPDLSSIRPDDMGFIPWKDAQRVILSGETVNVSQSHSLEVHITLKDGTRFKTREDRIDEVWALIKDNKLQNKIQYETE